MMSVGHGEKHGFTLIGVLVFCLILVPICASLARASRDVAHAVRDDLDLDKREFLAGGVAEAIAARLGSDKGLFGRLNGRWLTCDFSGNTFALTIRDHDGKVDLNNAASELLIAGFEAAGLDAERSRLLQQFVEASRSNGAVPRGISALLAKVSLKHAPFEHVDELQDVLAALESPTVDLDTMFTVDTGVVNVERATAPSALRLRLTALSNRMAVFEDNGTSDHIDVIVYVGAATDANRVALLKTYRKISPLGDMIEIRSSRLRPDAVPPVEPPQSNCRQLLGLRGEA